MISDLSRRRTHAVQGDQVDMILCVPGTWRTGAGRRPGGILEFERGR
jgi:hypothetical protein